MSDSDPGRSDVAELEGMIANGTPGRRRTKPTWHKRHRTLATILKIVMISLACWGLWIFWTHPLIQSAPLPAGIERGKQLSIGGGIPSLSTEAGNLTSDPPRARNHRWIGTLHWTRHDGSRDTITLHLGESTHIDGLGTITLLGVEPDPIMSTRNMGGFYYIINLTLDPDVTLQH